MPTENDRLKYDALQRALTILAGAQPAEGDTPNPQLQLEAQQKAYDALLSYLAPPPPPKKIVKLSDLQSMVDETFDVEVDLPLQGTVAITGRRLSPAELEVVQSIANSVLPPQVKGTPAEKPVFNDNDPDYLRNKKRVLITARAVALYTAYPMFREEKPKLEKHSDIYEFVQSKLTEPILETLFVPLNDGGLRKVALVNFTSASSRQS
jgi:hypothetical protein